jgi:hypothetical protein
VYFNSIITCFVSLSCQKMYLDVYKTFIFENTMMGIICSRNNQHNALTFTTALFIYAGSYMFWQQSAIFRELLEPSELCEIQINMEVYHIMWLSGLCVGVPGAVLCLVMWHICTKSLDTTCPSTIFYRLFLN